MNNIVYCGMCADIIHIGHINIIKSAKLLNCDKTVIGLLTDDAILTYKSSVYMKYSDRKTILEHIKGVDLVVEQDSLDYTKNLIIFKPRYVLHGDDWITGIQKSTREQVKNILHSYGGELIEVPYTFGVCSTSIKNMIIND